MSIAAAVTTALEAAGDVVVVGNELAAGPRVMPAATRRLRPVIARGVCLGGKRGVAIVTDIAGVRSAGVSGCSVLQPGWPADVASLLAITGETEGPWALRLHTRPAEDAFEPPVPSGWRPRLLADGGRGLLVGSGPTAPVVATVARLAASRGISLRAVDLPVLPPSAAATLPDLDRCVLLGGAGAALDRLDDLVEIPAVGVAHVVMDAVLARLTVP